MRPAFLCDDARTVVDLVEKGCGTGIVPLSATLALKQPNIIIQTITDCLITSRIDLIQPEHPYRNAYVEEFRQFIIQQCQ
ncbi:hypothetical protein SDC9_151264 [bioreactor metagenome]|uniref:LysR substrate-binding domain-containing protein n=1 Tax=bioreactor metagenome TaxID=1076179 RepID=A0A645EPT6_9ZZZZ